MRLCIRSWGLLEVESRILNNRLIWAKNLHKKHLVLNALQLFLTFFMEVFTCIPEKKTGKARTISLVWASPLPISCARYTNVRTFK